MKPDLSVNFDVEHETFWDADKEVLGWLWAFTVEEC